MGRRHQESGAASLFAVIFSTLLLTILTAGFIKLMISDQQRATNNSLSQGAYDAALTGVEDAKRVIRAAQQGNASAANALSNYADNCNIIYKSGVVAGSTSGETVVRSDVLGAGKLFDQAYTCVKIHMDTPDFIYKSRKDESQVIPLRAKSDFNKIVLEWYRRDDEDNLDQKDATNPSVSGEALPKEGAAWGSNTPSLLRAQLINPGEVFDIGRLDSTGATAFLKPWVTGVSPAVASELDVASRSRATDGEAHNNGVDQAVCDKKFAFSTAYSCKATLLVGGVSRSASQNAFLRINTLYKGASVRVSLMKDDTIVKFDGVQPAVEATGRASNLFRRVEARLKIGDDFAYPENAVELINSLCKDFSVADNKYLSGSCKP